VFKCILLNLNLEDPSDGSFLLMPSRDSSVGILTGRPRSRGSVPGWGSRFSLLHNVQTASVAHLASYTIDTWVKAAEASI
jgi:hypothetical protein